MASGAAPAACWPALLSPGHPGEPPAPGTLTPPPAAGAPEPRVVQVETRAQGVQGTSDFRTPHKKKVWSDSLIIFKIGHTSQSS